MDSENLFKIPSIPNTPSKVLSQISPNHMNQQRIPQSPSLPGHLSEFEKKLQSPYRNQHRNSDVRSIVEQWDRISQNGATPPASPTRTAGSSHAALQRAILGREEAEAQLVDAQVRERRMGERIEALMEELGEVREKLVSNKEKYKHEIIAVRKEAFKTDSKKMMVESELKEARAQCGRWRAEAERERQEKEKAQQEAFERAYALAGLVEEVEILKEEAKSHEKARGDQGAELACAVTGLTEEVESLKEKLQSYEKTAEDEKLPTSTEDLALKEEVEHLQRILDSNDKAKQEELAQKTQTITTLTEEVEILKGQLKPVVQPGMSAPPRSAESQPLETTDAEISKTAKPPKSLVVEAADAETSKTSKSTREEGEEQIREMKEKLRWWKTLHTRDEDLIHFLQMQCHFEACPCRLAESKGARFNHDRKAAENKRPREIKEEDNNVTSDVFSIVNITKMNSIITTRDIPTSPDRPDAPDAPAIIRDILSKSSIIKTEDTEKDTDEPDEDSVDETPDATGQLEDMTQVMVNFPLTPVAHQNIARPRPRSVHAATSFSGLETTTTTTVPLRGLDSDDVFTPAPKTPVTGSRSMPLTLRPITTVEDQMVPGTPVSRQEALRQIRERRDRARSVQLKSMRQVSHASAPGGI